MPSLASFAEDDPNTTYFMPMPKPWRTMLERWPEFDMTRAEPAEVTLTDELEDQLTSVQTGINARILYMRDQDRDVWQPAVTRGDCEDIALRKMQELLDWGWPLGALMPTICVAPQGGHAVLIVNTKDEYTVLDNLRWRPVKIGSLDYRWMSHAAPGAANGDWISMWRGTGKRLKMGAA